MFFVEKKNSTLTAEHAIKNPELFPGVLISDKQALGISAYRMLISTEA
jgi:hypothetical protein